MARLPRDPRFWLAGFLVWFAVLWVMSASSGRDTFAPPSDQNDKLAHFGYFFGGSGMFCAYLFRLKPDRPKWPVILAFTIVLLSSIGVLDEWHQSFTPGRSGNDPYDLMADVLGAVVGAFTFQRFHHWLK